MKVSVIIPLYNKAPYIAKALNSVLAQTFTDFECIIVNDGSTDNSLAIAHECISHDARCSIINQPNAGVSAARNRGIAESKGEYVAFLDADDWWKPTFLEDMLRMAHDFPNAGLYVSNYVYYKPGKTKVGVQQVFDIQSTMHNEQNWSGYINYPKTYYESNMMPVTSISVMIPMWVFKGAKKIIDGFPLGIELGEDFMTWSKIACCSLVAFINKPLAYYNNDVPFIVRATRRLHAPQSHMLWHLDEIMDCVCHVEDNTAQDWGKMMDKLRVGGLMQYWVTEEYHNAAALELNKVDWNVLDDLSHVQYYKKMYEMPIWYIRLHQYIKVQLSRVKQCIRAIKI